LRISDELRQDCPDPTVEDLRYAPTKPHTFRLSTLVYYPDLVSHFNTCLAING